MLTQITPCHGNTDVVMSNLPRWLMSPIDQLVLVDYACPSGLSKQLLSKPIGKNSKLTIIYVHPREAGPFYNQARAKNIGAKAAKGEYLLFLDPRAVVSNDFLEGVKLQVDGFESLDSETGEDVAPVVFDMFICESAKKFMTQEGYTLATELQETLNAGNPLKLDQLIIRNSTFYNLNGFNESNLVAGIDTIDLYCRAAKGEFTVTTRTELGLPMEEAVKFRFSSTASDAAATSVGNVLLNTDVNKHAEALELYSRMREMSPRAQPGRRFGLGDYSKDVKMYIGGHERVFNPGLD